MAKRILIVLACLASACKREPPKEEARIEVVTDPSIVGRCLSLPPTTTSRLVVVRKGAPPSALSIGPSDYVSYSYFGFDDAGWMALEKQVGPSAGDGNVDVDQDVVDALIPSGERGDAAAKGIHWRYPAYGLGPIRKCAQIDEKAFRIGNHALLAITSTM